MPELFDRPQKEKFNYPGVFDRAMPTVPVVAVEAPTASEDAPKPKRTVKKKEEEPRRTTAKKLNLGKPKL